MWCGVSKLMRAYNEKTTSIYFLPAAVFRAAQRAFINCESFFLPAGVSPLFLFAAVAVPILPFLVVQRALAAAASFARVVADTLRRPLAVEAFEAVVENSKSRRFCRASI